jgi:tRNA-modifying protein YgfZ
MICAMSAPAASTLTPAQTLAALDGGRVVRWWQVTAFVEAAGPDTATLLDGLCTQAVERLAPGDARLGLFLDAKARIIAPAVLHRTADAPWHPPRGGSAEPAAPRLLLETLPELVAPLTTHLTRYRLRSRVTIERSDISSIALVGAPHATPQGNDLVGEWTTRPEGWQPIRTFLSGADECARLVRDVLPARGLGLADVDTLEAARIETGTADLHDLLPGRMPAEVGGMQSAVALDAGCYLGQEPVARLHYRGRANRTLRRLEVIGTDAPVTGSEMPDDDATFALHRVGDEPGARAVGRLTTWARRPDGVTLALAMLRRELQPDEQLRLADGPTLLRVLDVAPD